MKVIKRDGSTVDFDRNKIVVAIQKANAAVEKKQKESVPRLTQRGLLGRTSLSYF